MSNLALILLAAYQLKHFLADFPLQNKWMLGKFKSGKSWIAPLAAHAGIHALLTFGIVHYLRPDLEIQLAALDFIVHFIVDRIKASPDLLGRFKSMNASDFAYVGAVLSQPQFSDIDRAEARAKIRNNTFFWWALGLDQMAHHLTHYFIIWRILS